MEYGEYTAYKQKALEIYENSKDYFSEQDFSNIESRYNSLKEGKFTLAVAGEVKAGKSTFLNAFLGKEILPADVLQATSAIIELFKADKEFVEVTYANGKIERVYDDLATPEVNEAREFLKNFSSVKEKYRDLPITRLNNFLLSFLSENKKEARFNEDDIGIFLSDLERNKSSYNLHNLSSEDFAVHVRDYLAEYRSKAGELPVRITFGFPLDFEFDGFRIVDTPGVNACGGIEDLTREYIKSADAIIYVTPIKPIESKSFKEFVNFSISDKSQEALLLILTHSAHYEPEERQRLLEEGLKIFNELNSNSVFSVDSLLRLYYFKTREFTTYDEITALVKSDAKMKKILADYVMDCEERDDFLNKIKDESGFEKVEVALKNLSRNAVSFQIGNFLKALSDKYSSCLNDYKAKVHDIGKALASPQKFENEIKQIEEQLENFRLRQNKFAKNLESEFQVRTGSKKEAEIVQYIDDYRKKIDSFLSSQNDLATIQSNTRNFSLKIKTDMENKAADVLHEIRAEVDCKIKNEEMQIGSADYVLPSVDLSGVWDKTVNIDKVEDPSVFDSAASGAAVGAGIGFFIPGVGTAIGAALGGLFGFSFGSGSKIAAEMDKKYAAAKALSNYKSDLNKHFQKSIDTLTRTMGTAVNDIVRNYLKMYNLEMDKIIDQRNQKLRDLFAEKDNCKKLEDDLCELNEKIKLVNDCLKNIEALEVNL